MDKSFFAAFLFFSALRMMSFSSRFRAPETNLILCMASLWTRMLEPRLSKGASWYSWPFALGLFPKGGMAGKDPEREIALVISRKLTERGAFTTAALFEVGTYTGGERGARGVSDHTVYELSVLNSIRPAFLHLSFNQSHLEVLDSEALRMAGKSI